MIVEFKIKRSEKKEEKQNVVPSRSSVVVGKFSSEDERVLHAIVKRAEKLKW
ncbi:hypothetical protein [Rouxiella silvae]|uniref:hypothetical protein n=1 Tax=Rouxiella silvae TaxID=1646373 RepID=UPI0039EE68BC